MYQDEEARPPGHERLILIVKKRLTGSSTDSDEANESQITIVKKEQSIPVVFKQEPEIITLSDDENDESDEFNQSTSSPVKSEECHSEWKLNRSDRKRKRTVDANQQTDILIDFEAEESKKKKILVEELESRFECPICFGIIHNPMQSNACRHVFCELCLFEALDKKDTCPTCQKPVKSVVVAPVMLTDLLDMYIEMDPDAKLPPDEVERRFLKTLELKSKFEIRMSIKSLEAAQSSRVYMPPTVGPIGMPRQFNAPRHWIDIERPHGPAHTPINYNHPARYAARPINPYNPAAPGPMPHPMQPVNQLQLQPLPQGALSTSMPMPYNNHYNPTNTFRQLNMYTQTFY
ncbi:hypothetical protein WR25_08078 [Diploscapter pachys]|uniref:RING-type domain-containing protein n=1 Tax=Diploscapter pachys TaxID=2018661 RepID=A0A2A2J4W4_9BILA|nr:hypothetical protein WR25_08078 [Diploscapter pachys]